MPSGVEHRDFLSPLGADEGVIPAPMPSGVEHTTLSCVPSTLSCDPRSDAFGR